VAAFSQYIVYADESGSPHLEADVKEFPIFVLVFAVLNKQHYAFDISPKIKMLKFDFVGHDQLILHERDIRRQSDAFAFLQLSEELRDSFLGRISEIIRSTDMEICAAIIDKAKYRPHHLDLWDPYERAVGLCIWAVSEALVKKGETDTEVTIVFESRGKKEDQLLELQIYRMALGQRYIEPESASAGFTFKPMFVDKKSNCAGLQLADLAARPLGLSHLKPHQPNRAADLLKAKLTPGGVMYFP
jgi:hypothetical protein